MNKLQTTAPDRAALERGYKNSRANLLLVVVFTLINIILAATGSSSYFLFSAFLPYIVSLFGLSFTGHSDFVSSDLLIAGDWFLYLTLGFSAAVLILYFVFYLLSNKHYGWLIPALVFFAIDCAFIAYFAFSGGFDFSLTLDILFHVWVLISLILGVVNGAKLKKLPSDAPLTADFTDKTDAVLLNGEDFKGEK